MDINCQLGQNFYFSINGCSMNITSLKSGGIAIMQHRHHCSEFRATVVFHVEKKKGGGGN